jgi:hypothetical protein
MAVRATCPNCQTVHNLADRLLGATVRCKNCAGAMVVGDASEQPTIPERPSPLAKARVPRRRDRESERELQQMQRRRRRLLIGAISGCAVLFLLGVSGVVAALVWYFNQPAGNRPGGAVSDLLVDVSGPWPQVRPIAGAPANTVVIVRIAGVADEYTRDAAFDKLQTLLATAAAGGSRSGISSSASGDRMTVALAPIRDVKAFAQQLDFGTVRSVNDRTITMVAHKVQGPAAEDTVSKALYRLGSSSAHRRAEGVRALKDTLPSEERRGEVRKALEPLLNDPDRFVRQLTIEALGVWGNKDTIAALDKVVAENDIFVSPKAKEAIRAINARK